MGNRIIIQYDLEEDVYDPDAIRSFEEYLQHHVEVTNGWTPYAAKILSGSDSDLHRRACDTEAYRQLVTGLHHKYYRNDLPGDDYPPEYWTEFNAGYDKILKDLASQ